MEGAGSSTPEPQLSGRSTISVGLAEKWDSQVLPFKKISNDCNDNVVPASNLRERKTEGGGVFEAREGVPESQPVKVSYCRALAYLRVVN